MSQAADQPKRVDDRLVRFRQLRALLDPAGDAAQAMGDGLYVDDKGALHHRIAAELKLAPSSSHLLVGGVGSGKTTQLHATGLSVGGVGDTTAFFVDVSKDHDIGQMAPGTVAVQVGIVLGDFLVKAAPHAEATALVQGPLASLRALAHGFFDEYGDYPDDDGPNYVAGILQPAHTFPPSVGVALVALRDLRARFPPGRHVVVLIDGLDRMTNIDAFSMLVDNDIRALTSVDIGVVLVGPLRALYGLDHALTDRFDRVHYQPWHDIAGDTKRGLLLIQVLKKRVGDVFDGEALAAVVVHSGGVMRDLLALAQGACVEAYMDGSDVIDGRHAAAAIDAFGRKHMQGLRMEEIAVLQRVRTSGAFVEASEHDLALLMTRRVLEYRDAHGVPRHVVHPTIEGFLMAMG